MSRQQQRVIGRAMPRCNRRVPAAAAHASAGPREPDALLVKAYSLCLSTLSSCLH